MKAFVRNSKNLEAFESVSVTDIVIGSPLCNSKLLIAIERYHNKHRFLISFIIIYRDVTVILMISFFLVWFY